MSDFAVSANYLKVSIHLPNNLINRCHGCVFLHLCLLILVKRVVFNFQNSSLELFLQGIKSQTKLQYNQIEWTYCYVDMAFFSYRGNASPISYSLVSNSLCFILMSKSSNWAIRFDAFSFLKIYIGKEISLRFSQTQSLLITQRSSIIFLLSVSSSA